MLVTLSFGALVSFVNWIWSRSVPYFENYWYWFLAGSTAGLFLGLFFHRMLGGPERGF